MKKITLLFATFLSLYAANAQDKDNKWAIQAGFHAEHFNYDDGGFFQNYFKVRDWNVTPPISYVGVYRHWTSGLSGGVNFSIGKVGFRPKTDKVENLFVRPTLDLKYSFLKKGWFDPYASLGAGATYIDYKSGGNKWFATGSAGLGVNFWVEKNIGLFVQSTFNYLAMPKHTYATGTGSDADVTYYTDANVKTDRTADHYLQHSAGLIFKFGKKDKDGDGIADDKDACPDVFGLEKFNGCPDTDGDGIADKDDACPKEAGKLNGCPDTDGDGVADKDDACPTVAGTVALSGCPDSDGDGIADKDDACPTVAGLSKFKGCPDTDGDGITDKEDECPSVAGRKNLNGCPDSDGDGIADKNDRCPNEAGVAELNGCPKPKMKEEEKKEIEKKIAFAAKSIQFETGKDVIRKESFDELDQIVSIMGTYPSVNFKVEGHTDNVGNSDKNLDLSARRAAAVKAYFMGKGIAASRLASYGYGQERPIADNATAAGRAKNRRVDITVNQ